MAQASSASTTSRRSFLGAVAVSTIAAVPQAAAQQHPDAALIALGEQFDDLLRRLDEALAHSAPLWDRHTELMDKWWETHLPSKDGALAAYKQFEIDLGLHKLNAEKRDPESITNLASKLGDRIMAMSPVTAAGLAVQSRVLAYDLGGLEGADDASVYRPYVRAFVLSVTRLAASAV